MTTGTHAGRRGSTRSRTVPIASGGGKRRDIQGLRALAVGLVVVFHLLPSLVPGGYIGVDVFFVISGFLITAHLVRELENTGRVRITEFWARRVRRLLPASLLVLAVCVVLTFTVMPAITRPQNFTEIAFASGYVLNWNLAASAVDYLNATNPESLVQHYWSLSVEEQFYLVWPILLTVAVFVAARSKMRAPGARSLSASVKTRRGVLSALLLVFVLSLAFSIFETARSQPSAYFITTTRAWEFALGGLVALVPGLRLSEAVRAVFSWIALAAIMACAFLFGPGTSFPGSIALIPVVAAAVLILVGDSGAAFSPQRLARVAPVQSIGDLSYSIYLWHWPLIVVVAANISAWPSWVRIPLILVATLVLAMVTERFVERPFRKPRGAFRRRSVTFGAMTVSIGVIVAVTVLAAVGIQNAVDQRQSDLQEQLAGGGSSPTQCIGAQAVYNDCSDPFAYTDLVDPAFAQGDGPWAWFDSEPAISACSSATVGSWVERSCDFESASDEDAPRVLLIGDSHADHIVSPVQRVAANSGWDLQVATRQACNPFRAASDSDDDNAARCVAWGTDLIRQTIADVNIQVVIFSTRGDSGVWKENAASAFRELQAAGKTVIVISDTPNVDGRQVSNGDLITGPACVLAAGSVDDACSWTDERRDTWVEETASAEGVPVIDLRSVVCPDGVCHAVVGGLIAFSDENHFSGSYALSLAGWFDSELTPIVDAAISG